MGSVTSFKYLGAVVSDDGFKPDVLSRIAQATAAVTKLKPIWRDNNISLGSRVKLIRPLVISTFLYACELWTFCHTAVCQLLHKCSNGNYFYSILIHPITLEGHRDNTDKFATIPFLLVLFSAALVELAKSIPVYSLILSSHLFFCQPLLREGGGCMFGRRGRDGKVRELVGEHVAGTDITEHKEDIIT